MLRSLALALLVAGCDHDLRIEMPVPCATPCLDLADGGLCGWDSGWPADRDDCPVRDAGCP
jgi:hypothetical protein